MHIHIMSSSVRSHRVACRMTPGTHVGTTLSPCQQDNHNYITHVSLFYQGNRRGKKWARLAMPCDSSVSK